MLLAEIQRAFKSLPAVEQARLLALLSFNLTIHVRDLCSDADPGDKLQRVCAMNELQHVVCSHTASVLQGDSHRYSDDALWKIVFERAQASGCVGRLHTALEWAMSAVAKREG